MSNWLVHLLMQALADTIELRVVEREGDSKFAPRVDDFVFPMSMTQPLA